jgi:hypothetical protein
MVHHQALQFMLFKPQNIEMVPYQNETCKPKNGSQEGKGFRCTPAGALVMQMLDAVPPERRAAVGLVEPIQQHAEGGKPAGAEKKVGRVMHHVVGEREHPHEAEQKGNGGENFGVNLTTKWLAISSMGPVVQVQLVRHDAENDLERISDIV